MDAAIIVTAIVLVAATAALALAPQLHLGYPQEAADLALDTARRLSGCWPTSWYSDGFAAVPG